jgi:iron complex outermembrane receptor protein
MRWNDRRRGQVWLLVVAVVLFPLGVGAQDEELDDDLDESEIAGVSAEDGLHEGIETITVTVQKRSQTLQEVPAAASAVTGRQLNAAGITQVQDIQSFVPSMHYGQERGEAKITIRGVSNAQGTDQSTAVHTDGIFQNRARSITSLTFFDVNRVEILRGPQGTLYGRNATGGAMNIISVPPSDKIEAFGDFQIGNYHQLMVRGVLNVPIVEDLAAFRVSGFWENRDGYQENFIFSGSDQDADDADDFGIRSQLLLTPRDSLDMTLRFNYAQKSGVGYALKRDGPLPEFVELVPGFPPLDQQPIYEGATPNPSNERHVFLDAKGDIDNETISGNANLEWQVPEIPFFGATKLRVLGSYTDFDDYSVNDQDYSDLPLTVASQWWEGNEWVAEIDWSSDYGDDAGWLLGIFHLGTTGDNTIDAPSKIPIFPDLDDLSSSFNILVPFNQDFDSSAYSVAGFVNGWYHLTDKLRVEAGVRYSHDWKKSDLVSPTIFLQEEGEPPTTFVLFQGVDDHRTDDWGEPTGSFSLDYPITDQALLYGRFATGYKAGTLNNDIAPIGGTFADPDCDPDPAAPNCDGLFSPEDADPENLYALEAGLKNTLLDNRLLLNGTAFIYWYHDLQVSQLFETQYFVDNAADARIFGIELESTWIPVDSLTLEAQFSFLDTDYTDYEGCLDAKDFSVQDCTGNELSRAPRFSGSFTATYEFDFERFGSVTPFAQVYASDDVFFRPTNEAADTQDAYFLMNFRLAWRSEGSGLGLDLFIDNALDKDVATTKIVGSSLLGSPLVDAYDRPRTIGARAYIAW